MCRNDENPPPGSPPRNRPKPGDFVANLRSAGLPWHRVAAQAVANNWRKLRNGRNCCGNLGQPGC